jgi:DNA gyrase/topoisomerase IV subunit B
LIAVVSVKHLKPIFSGQAKEIFSNRDIVPFIKELMSDGLDEWCKTNSSDLQKVCRHFKDAADLRLKQDKDKVTMVKKYNVSAINGLPAKYLKPNGKEHLELVIVEGDSAKAPCSTARDAERQGIFPVRGKVANAMAESEAKFFGNEECQGIRDLLGSGYGRKFDLDKCKFEKIIIMCDADLDGLHIRTLLLKMFLVYYRAIVEDGRLYSAVPPLYYANIKGKFKYFIDKLDFVKYVQSRFGSDNKVFDANNNQISQKDLTGILCRNSNYRDELKVISDTYAVDPFLLEYAMSIRNLPFDKFKKAISKKYRFLNTYQENGITILDGLVGEKIHTVIFNQNFVDACSSLYHYIDKEADKYIINGEPTTLYGLMDRFEAYKPPNVQRYKGLGEMNPLQLRESTLHPDYDRVLLRYTTEDIKREIEEIREVECNKALLLKDADIAGFEL